MGTVYDASSASLTRNHLSEFYETMKRVVWRIHFHHSSNEEKVVNGVCVSKDGLILCPFLGENLSDISLTNPDRSQMMEVERVHMDEEDGVGLLRVCGGHGYNHVLIASQEESLEFGRDVYSIVYPNKSTHILLTGQVSHPWRTRRDVPHLGSASPPGLHCDVPLTQIVHLGASDESPQTTNDHGYVEGRGAPLFDAWGKLVGLISFQYRYFDFAIHPNVFRHLVVDYSN